MNSPSIHLLSLTGQPMALPKGGINTMPHHSASSFPSMIRSFSSAARCSISGMLMIAALSTFWG